MTAHFGKLPTRGGRNSSRKWTDLAVATGEALVPTSLTTPSLTADISVELDAKRVTVRGKELNSLITEGLALKGSGTLLLDLKNGVRSEIVGKEQSVMKVGEDMLKYIACVLEALVNGQLIEPGTGAFPKTFGFLKHSKSSTGVLEKYSSTPLSWKIQTIRGWQEEIQRLYFMLVGLLSTKARRYKPTIHRGTRMAAILEDGSGGGGSCDGTRA